MPKQELEKDALEAVIEDGAPEIENEESEAAFLAAFEEEDDGYTKPEPDPVPETGPDEAGKGDEAEDTDDEEEVEDPKPDDDGPGDPDEESTDPDEDGETPPWMKRMEEMENRMATRMRNVEGHLGGLKSQMMQAKTEAAADGETAPTATQIKDATGRKGSTGKLDALREEFPEWADALDELADNYSSVSSPQVETFTREEVSFLLQDATTRAVEMAKVHIAHPGWEDTRNTPEFVQWRDSQPETTQVLADSPKAADAIKMFDLYKEATQPPAPANKGKTRDRLKRSVAPRTTGAAPVQHVPTEEEDFLAAFNS